jgi:hypothetical protein
MLYGPTFVERLFSFFPLGQLAGFEARGFVSLR